MKLIKISLFMTTIFFAQAALPCAPSDQHEKIKSEQVKSSQESSACAPGISAAAAPTLYVQQQAAQDMINTSIPDFNPELHVMTYNIDQAVFDENFEKTKWKNREARIKAMINMVNADIVCVQELRELGANPSPNQFLSSLNQYRFSIAHSNPTPGSFGNATLYNPAKLFPIKSFPKWLSDTPDVPSDTYSPKKDAAWGKIVLCTKFMLVSPDRKVVSNQAPFWVFNTHFPLDENAKMKSAAKLLEIIAKVAKKNPYIVCGDFNFFPDKDGAKQRQVLAKTMQDLGETAVTNSGNAIGGAYVGYTQDKAHAKDLKNMVDRLDHIFASQAVEKLGKAAIFTRTMHEVEPAELSDRDALPSDHLPLTVKVKIK